MLFDVDLSNVRLDPKSGNMQNRKTILEFLLERKIYQTNPVTRNNLSHRIGISTRRIHNALDPVSVLSPRTIGAVGVKEEYENRMLSDFSVYLRNKRRAREYLWFVKRYF